VLLVPLVVLLVLGALVADQINAALGLSFTPVRVPAEHLTAGSAAPMVAPPDLTRIAVPADRRIALAAQAVVSAYTGRGLAAPVLGAGAGPELRVRLAPTLPGGTGPESSRLDRSGSGLTITATTSAGAANALYTLADRIRSGADVTAGVGRVTTPRLPLRLTDVGAVGLNFAPGAFAWGTDYSLNTDVVGSALLPHAPWVDPAAVATISTEFHTFVDHALTEGYNGIVLPGFLEYLTFAGVGNGHAVYRQGDPHVARALAMRAAFGPVWKYAHDMGMTVYLSTDMLTLSPPLKRYLGTIDATSGRLWSTYRAGLHELFTSMPYVGGLMIRIGEGGADYKLAGWDYYSEIDVTTPAAVRAMLTALLATADGDDRDIVFRTWTVGVGAVGDLHTNPASYDTVLNGITDPHLIVSTKYSAGDFYSHLPLNATLATGGQRRIIEFQSRREFEGQGALPDDLAALEQQALRTALAENPHIVGVWDWTQDGGPLYAGPRDLYLISGFWQLWDLNVYLTARLAEDPDTNTGAATVDWIRQMLATDPVTVTALAQVFALSRSAITEGLYIGPYADDSVTALGLQPPPMMWIFEWDIVTGDSAALDSIYQVSRAHLEQAITEGDQAIATARAMQRLVDATPVAGWRDPMLRPQFVAAAAYEVNLLDTLGAYRTMVLRHVQWLDTGSAAAKREWYAAQTRYEAARTVHLRTYGHDLALPAYNVTAADIGVLRADRDPAMAWLARALLALILLAFALGRMSGRRRPTAGGDGTTRGHGPGSAAQGNWPGSAALCALWLGATRPWRVGEVTPRGRTDRVLVWLVPALVLVLSRWIFTWFLAPAHMVLTLGGWLLLALALRLLIGRREPFALYGALGGAAMLRTIVLLAALVNRGPGRYWYDFWTAPGLRGLYVTVAFAAFGWVFVVAFVVLRDAYGVRRRPAYGKILAGVGVPLAVAGTGIALIGAERAVTIWNDQMALLPWGLSRILGITTYLGIPTYLPVAAAVLGGVLIALGALLHLRRAVGRLAVTA